MSKPERIIDDEGREILVYPDGTRKVAATGHFLRGPNLSPVKIDPHGMGARGNRKKEIARIKGIIRGTGLPMPPEENLEALADAEASAIEILTAVMTNAFMNSENLRGMAEVWNKLTGSKDDEGEKVTVDKDDLLQALAEFAARVPDAVEGKVIE